MRVILPIRDLPTRLVVDVERLPIFASRSFTRLAYPAALGDRVDSVTVQNKIVTVVTTKPCIETRSRFITPPDTRDDELTFGETRELTRSLARGA